MSGYRPFAALVKYHVVAAMSTTRWRLVPPAYLFILIAFLVPEYHTARLSTEFNADANVWDVGLRFFSNVFHDVLIMLLGLILLVGDDLVRGFQNGTMRSTVLLSRSVERWWRAKVLAMGVCAFVYMGIVFVSTILASLVMGVRIELGSSGGAARIEREDPNTPWYHLPAGWSTLGYELFSVFSMAFTMWAIVVLYHAASLFVFPNRRIPLFVFFGWVVVGFVVQASGQWWDLRFLLYPGKCFSEFGRGATSIPVFFAFVTALLLGATVLGQRRLQRMDL